METKMVYDSEKGLPQEVIGALADAFNKSFATIIRWVEGNNHILTSDLAKEVFAKKNIEWNPQPENKAEAGKI